MKETDIKLNIMLVSDDEDDVKAIKSKLQKSMRIPWNMMHCVNLSETKHRMNKADIVILDLGLEQSKSPEKLFDHISDMVFEIPIIVLTGKRRGQHELAIYVMEQGAADNMIRGQFGRLVDAIEFSILRQKNKTSVREANELGRKDAQDRSDAAYDCLRADSEVDHDKMTQLLRMFCGGYSVSNEQNK